MNLVIRTISLSLFKLYLFGIFALDEGKGSLENTGVKVIDALQPVLDDQPFSFWGLSKWQHNVCHSLR
jgi:hypothetical protein